MTLAPARLILNYLFKKTNSVWVTFIVHFIFDFIAFLPILLK
ncbi:CPBP family glutamic-type intramembrane protease [Listeria monocytogenes]